jgi:AraC-like DNA-binding protein
MEINIEKISSYDHVTYTVREYIQPSFIYPRHYHPEFELTYIGESYGKLYAGNAVIDFRKGDLFLIAPGVIHSFKNPKNYSDSKVSAKATCVFFERNFLGSDFFNRKEARMLNELFKKATLGVLYFTPDQEFTELLKGLMKAKELRGVAILLEILDILSLDRNVRLISNDLLLNKYYFRYSKDDRIEKICDYMSRHYNDRVTCREVANMISMSEPAFSRFFKLRTEKTFTRVLNEIRVANAQKLLLESDKNVNEIGKECGYNNLSHFNRQFKSINKMSPGEFREYHL